MAAATRPLPPREWLDVHEAAAFVGMHPDTLALAAREAGSPIQRKCRKGRGSKHMYRVSSLLRWIETWGDV